MIDEANVFLVKTTVFPIVETLVISVELMVIFLPYFYRLRHMIQCIYELVSQQWKPMFSLIETYYLFLQKILFPLVEKLIVVVFTSFILLLIIYITSNETWFITETGSFPLTKTDLFDYGNKRYCLLPRVETLVMSIRENNYFHWLKHSFYCFLKLNIFSGTFLLDLSLF